MQLLCILLAIITILNAVKSETKPKIFIEVPKTLTVFKGHGIELTCFASTTNPNETQFKWILPEVETYIEEDRKKRIVEEQHNFGEDSNTKILKLIIPSIKYQDRGAYFCVGQDGNDESVAGRTLVIVEEHTGFAPAIWILVGFLLMTAVSIGVIMVLEWKGISKMKEEDVINQVQF